MKIHRFFLAALLLLCIFSFEKTFCQQFDDPYPLVGTLRIDTSRARWWPMNYSIEYIRYFYNPLKLTTRKVYYYLDSTIGNNFYYRNADTVLFLYDSGGTFVKQVDKRFPEYETIFRFAGKKVISEREYWKKTEILRSKDYSYDYRDRIIQWIRMSGSNDIFGDFEINILPPFRINWVYDTNDNIDTIRIFSRDTSSGVWKAKYIQNYYYTLSGNDSVYIQRIWKDTGWVIKSSIRYVRDKTGRLLRKEIYLDSLVGVDSFFYNSDKLIEIRHRHLDSAKWRNFGNDYFFYSADGKLVKADYSGDIYNYESEGNYTITADHRGPYIGYYNSYYYYAEFKKNLKRFEYYNDLYGVYPGNLSIEYSTYYYDGDEQPNLIYSPHVIADTGKVILYPNPVSSILKITATSNTQGLMNVKVFDIAGKLLIEKIYAMFPGVYDFSLDLSELRSSAMYLVKVTGPVNQSKLILKY